jgi:CHAT domain-containing protein
MQLTQILQPGGHDESGEERQLRGHPLVVLSACELGGFLEMGMPGEQTGFPAGFMAMGARAVVGSLWLVLDGRPTRRLMEDFHRRLADLPPNAALSATIAQAHLSGVPRLIWGSLSHYGV